MLWSAPTFWLGLILLVGLGVGAGPLPGLFPTGGLHDPATPGGIADVLRHLALPCLTLTAVQYAQYHVLVRASVREQRASPYVTLARATGLREAQVTRARQDADMAMAGAAAAGGSMGVGAGPGTSAGPDDAPKEGER